VLEEVDILLKGLYYGKELGDLDEIGLIELSAVLVGPIFTRFPPLGAVPS
jgi:hypothetical protein